LRFDARGPALKSDERLIACEFALGARSSKRPKQNQGDDDRAALRNKTWRCPVAARQAKFDDRISHNCRRCPPRTSEFMSGAPAANAGNPRVEEAQTRPKIGKQGETRTAHYQIDPLPQDPITQ